MNQEVGNKQRRVMLKVSGEVFGGGQVGMDLDVINSVAHQIGAAVEQGVQVAVVVGGGNFFRGAELSQRGDAVGYVPLDKRTWFVPEVLEGMEQLALVCIDNIECVAGDEPWDMAIFNLYNRILESGKTRLLITGDRPPRQLNLGLPDLASRLDWGQIYKLQPLSDEDKLQALQLRARLRGFEMPEDVCRFLLKRLDREMRSLFMILDQLDHASITAQRKLTIPFVKEILKL